MNEDYKLKIFNLKDGECWIWPESDYGKAEIWCKNRMYFLFSIPMYGGEPEFEKAFSRHYIDDLIDTVDSWT